MESLAPFFLWGGCTSGSTDAILRELDSQLSSMGLPVRVVPLVVDGSSSGVRGALAPLRSTDCLAPHPSCISSLATYMQGWGGTPRDAGCLRPVDSASAESTFCLLEMEAVRLALLAFLPSLRGSQVLVRSDYTSVACNKQGGCDLHHCRGQQRPSCSGRRNGTFH